MLDSFRNFITVLAMGAKIYFCYNFYLSTWRNNMMTEFLFLNILGPKPGTIEGEECNKNFKLMIV